MDPALRESVETNKLNNFFSTLSIDCVIKARRAPESFVAIERPQARPTDLRSFVATVAVLRLAVR